jgi:hypothetical protein
MLVGVSLKNVNLLPFECIQDRYCWRANEICRVMCEEIVVDHIVALPDSLEGGQM